MYTNSRFCAAPIRLGGGGFIGVPALLELVAILTAGLLVFISAAIQHANTVSTLGLGFVLTDRSKPLAREGFAGRAARTLQNNLESAAMFVPGAVIVSFLGHTSAVTTLAAAAYIAARLGFTLSYWVGASRPRSFFWGIGMAAIAAISAAAALALVGG